MCRRIQLFFFFFLFPSPPPQFVAEALRWSETPRHLHNGAINCDPVPTDWEEWILNMLFKQKVQQTRMSLSNRSLNRDRGTGGRHLLCILTSSVFCIGDLLFWSKARTYCILHCCLLRGHPLKTESAEGWTRQVHLLQDPACLCSHFHFLLMLNKKTVWNLLSIHSNTLACFECFTLKSLKHEDRLNRFEIMKHHK